MRIVMAGSSGLIGSALLAELRRAGHDVHRFVRRPPTAADEVRWNPTAGEIADGALAGVDAVINLCGASIATRRWTGARKQVLRDSRAAPTEVLAHGVARQGVPVLINASAVGYYGDTGDRMVDEASPPGTGFLASLCQDWESATTPAKQAGTRVVLLRTGLVLSRHGGLLANVRPLFAVGLGGRFGWGKQYWPWISITDETAAIRFLAEHDTISGPVNLTGPEPVTNAEFTAALGATLHRPAPWFVPGSVMKLAFGEDLVAESILSGQRALPRVLTESGFAFAHRTVRAALASVLGG